MTFPCYINEHILNEVDILLRNLTILIHNRMICNNLTLTGERDRQKGREEKSLRIKTDFKVKQLTWSKCYVLRVLHPFFN